MVDIIGSFIEIIGPMPTEKQNAERNMVSQMQKTGKIMIITTLLKAQKRDGLGGQNQKTTLNDMRKHKFS